MKARGLTVDGESRYEGEERPCEGKAINCMESHCGDRNLM